MRVADPPAFDTAANARRVRLLSTLRRAAFNLHALAEQLMDPQCDSAEVERTRDRAGGIARDLERG